MDNAAPVNELLECFRRGTDDLHGDAWSHLRAALDRDPALRRRLEQIQRSDSAIRRAMHEVPLPAGLESRLRTALLAAAETPAATVSLPDRTAPQSASLFRSRRAWLGAGGLLTALAVAALAAVYLPTPSERSAEVPQAVLVANVQEWLSEAVASPENSWTRDTAAAPSHPLPSALARRPHRWRRLPTSADRGQVVYDLAGPGRPAALLFVVRTRQPYENIPSTPMARWSMTGSFKVGAWQSGEFLYVLVVDEENAPLEEFVRPARIA